MALPRLLTVLRVKWLVSFAVVLTCVGLGFATTVFSKAGEKLLSQKPVKHTWNLQDADILSVINTVSTETGKNFVIDPRVTGKVNLISSVPLGPDELYPVFLSVLDVYGFAAVPSGDIIKIVPNLTAIKGGAAFASRQKPGQGDELIVRALPTHNISAQQVVGVLRPLLPQWSYVSAYVPTNIVILSGPAHTLTRMAGLIQAIDRASDSDVDIVTLKTANAAQVVTLLQALQNNQRDLRNKASLVADSNSNRILIGGDRILRLRMHALILQLDQTSQEDNNNSQIIYLHYLKSKDFAPILQKIAQGSGESSAKNTSKVQQVVQVQSEDSTNSLIITAPLSVMHSLKEIVRKLDVRPSQVLVQAIIVELNASATEKLGIQWGTVNDDLTGTENSDGSPGHPEQEFKGGIGVGVIRSGSFRALIAALKGISNADILSQPTIVVLDNKKAVFSVGKQVSVIDSSTGAGNSGSSASGVPFTTSSFSRQNVGLELDVTPQIGQGDAVQLLIKQKNDSLQNPDNPGDTPIVNNSQIDTSVIVNSNDILVLGGLMKNALTDGVSSTPILGDIPLLGRLFQHKTHNFEKKNLLVFIRPVILKTPVDGTRVSEQRYDRMRRTQAEWHKNWLKENNNPEDRRLAPRHQLLVLPVPFAG